MDHKLHISDQCIHYTLKRRRGLSGIRISVRPWGEMTVTAGTSIPHSFIESYLHKESLWIITTLDKLSRKRIAPPKKYSKTEIKQLKIKTQRLIDSRLDYFGPQLRVSWNRVTIRHQSTRWGSCSREGNLNFNCRLAEVPDELIDYVVVHELCHLLQMNHSPKFWALVESILPDYKHRRRALHKYALSIG